MKNVQFDTEFISIENVMEKIKHSEITLNKNNISDNLFNESKYEKSIKNGLPIPEKIIILHHGTNENKGNNIILNGSGLLNYIKKNYKNFQKNDKDNNIVDYTVIYSFKNFFNDEEETEWVKEIVKTYI